MNGKKCGIRKSESYEMYRPCGKEARYVVLSRGERPEVILYLCEEDRKGWTSGQLTEIRELKEDG